MSLNDRDIQDACVRKDQPRVLELLEIRGSTDMMDKQGRNCLHIACMVGCVDIVSTLQKHGQDVNGIDIHCNTPLLYACESNHLEVVELQQQHGAFLDLCNTDAKYPVHWACKNLNIQILELLCIYKAKIHVQDIDWNTPLFHACIELRGKQRDISQIEPIINLLISLGADIHHINKSNFSLLYYASLYTNYASSCTVTEQLVKHGADPRQLQRDKRNVLYYICKYPKKIDLFTFYLTLPCAVELINKQDDTKESVLSWQCEQNMIGHLDKVFSLDGIEIDTRIKGHYFLLDAMQRKHYVLADKLLLYGADAHVVDKNGRTLALEYSLAGKWAQLLTLQLRTEDTDLNIVDKHGNSVLEYVVQHCTNESVLGSIFSCNLHVNRGVGRFVSAMHYACNFRKLFHVRQILRNNADVNMQDAQGNTPLMLATWADDTDIVELLLLAEADPNIPDFGNKSPLQAACTRSSTLVSMLQEYKADPNIYHDVSEAPIFVACSRVHWDMMCLLVQNNLNQHTKDKMGRTLLHHTVNTQEAIHFDKLLETILSHLDTLNIP